MNYSTLRSSLLACTIVATSTSTAAWAGQAPGAASSLDIPISHRDRVYAAEQFSNTVSVTDPVDNKLLGVIRLGDPQPGNFSPLYKGQVLVHGLGYSPDHKTLAVVSIGSNSVTFIDTATNAVKHTTYVGRSPHEAFFTPDGKEVWVTVRGENYISVIDASSFAEKTRIEVPAGPGMQIFSPDGKYGYICSSFNPDTVVVSVADHAIVARVKQESPFCPNIAATPDGDQVWFTLKDIGKTQVFNARPPFNPIKTIETGPITNHVNFARTPKGTFAYVTIGGTNEVKVFRTDDFSQAATIPVGNLPHGIWPSGDGTRIYVGLENADALAAIDTATNKVVANIPIGQAPQAIAYVPGAAPNPDDRQNLQNLGVAGQVAHLTLGARAEAKGENPPTSVSLFDQGLIQILQASVTGLQPKQRYVLALADQIDGSGRLQPLAAFMTNPAGAAIVNATGPIRQIVQNSAKAERRYLVIAPESPSKYGDAVQVQTPMNDMLHLVEPVIPALRRYARALVRNRATADDLVQDCLERAVRHWHARREGDPRPWLFTILHNLAVNQFRRSARRGKHIAIDEANEDDFGQDAVQEQKLIYQDVLDKLARLPEDQRAVLLLVAVEDLSYADTARVLDIPIGTVMSRLSRAREKLQQEIEGTADGAPKNVVQLRSMK